MDEEGCIGTLRREMVEDNENEEAGDREGRGGQAGRKGDRKC